MKWPLTSSLSKDALINWALNNNSLDTMTWLFSRSHRPCQANKKPLNMHKMHSFRSSCILTKSYPGLCSPFIHSAASNDSASGLWRPWLDCVNVKADLSLCYITYARTHVFARIILTPVWAILFLMLKTNHKRLARLKS